MAVLCADRGAVPRGARCAAAGAARCAGADGAHRGACHGPCRVAWSVAHRAADRPPVAHRSNGRVAAPEPDLGWESGGVATRSARRRALEFAGLGEVARGGRGDRNAANNRVHGGDRRRPGGGGSLRRPAVPRRRRVGACAPPRRRPLAGGAWLPGGRRVASLAAAAAAPVDAASPPTDRDPLAAPAFRGADPPPRTRLQATLQAATRRASAGHHTGAWREISPGAARRSRAPHSPTVVTSAPRWLARFLAPGGYGGAGYRMPRRSDLFPQRGQGPVRCAPETSRRHPTPTSDRRSDALTSTCASGPAGRSWPCRRCGRHARLTCSYG